MRTTQPTKDDDNVARVLFAATIFNGNIAAGVVHVHVTAPISTIWAATEVANGVDHNNSQSSIEFCLNPHWDSYKRRQKAKRVC